MDLFALDKNIFAPSNTTYLNSTSSDEEPQKLKDQTRQNANYLIHHKCKENDQDDLYTNGYGSAIKQKNPSQKKRKRLFWQQFGKGIPVPKVAPKIKRPQKHCVIYNDLFAEDVLSFASETIIRDLDNSAQGIMYSNKGTAINPLVPHVITPAIRILLDTINGKIQSSFNAIIAKYVFLLTEEIAPKFKAYHLYDCFATLCIGAEQNLQEHVYIKCQNTYQVRTRKTDKNGIFYHSTPLLHSSTPSGYTNSSIYLIFLREEF